MFPFCSRNCLFSLLLHRLHRSRFALHAIARATLLECLVEAFAKRQISLLLRTLDELAHLELARRLHRLLCVAVRWLSLRRLCDLLLTAAAAEERAAYTVTNN